jgi:hypothetical protein
MSTGGIRLRVQSEICYSTIPDYLCAWPSVALESHSRALVGKFANDDNDYEIDVLETRNLLLDRFRRRIRALMHKDGAVAFYLCSIVLR